MKILSLLTQSKEEREKKAAERTARTLKRNQEALIDNLEAKRDDLEDQKAKLLNLSSGKIPSDWNEKLQETILELELIEKEIEIAEKTLAEYFTEVKAKA